MDPLDAWRVLYTFSDFPSFQTTHFLNKLILLNPFSIPQVTLSLL